MPLAGELDRNSGTPGGAPARRDPMDRQRLRGATGAPSPRSPNDVGLAEFGEP